MIALLLSAAEAAEVIPQQQEMTMSLFSLFLKGGVLMWILLALSIAAIYIIGKKWWMIGRAGKVDKNFTRNVGEMLHEGRYKAARSLCAKTDSAIARLVQTGIEKIGKPAADIQAAVENTGSAEVAKLERGLPILATIAGGAPMIGFLGTVIGMVQAFFNMSQAGNNIDITMLSGGIYVAMVTTVGGLIVGIIAYFGYNYLSSRISDLVTKMESVTFDLVEVLKTKTAEPKKEETGKTASGKAEPKKEETGKAEPRKAEPKAER